MKIKSILFYALTLVVIEIGCKPKKQILTSLEQGHADVQQITPGEISGRISHQFRTEGCPTIIIVSQGEKDSLVLIPSEVLPSNVDINGLEVLFNYHTLRIPQPNGCNLGIPAEITNITKEK